METNPEASDLPVALTIAGSDSGANAGLQADLLSFAANAVYGTTAITCVTAQNPKGITRVDPMPPPLVAAQIEQICRYYHPKAIKTGMLFNQSIIQVVCDTLNSLKTTARIVVDPVMVASSGHQLIDDSAIDLMKQALLPLADLITPNLDEAAILSQTSIVSIDDMEQAARSLAQRFHAAILIKGGHLNSDSLADILCLPDGEIEWFKQQRIPGIDTHGSGCTLSAAITAFLARGRTLPEAVSQGLRYLRSAMESPVILQSRPFINHFPEHE